MMYTLPAGHLSAQTLEFPNAVQIIRNALQAVQFRLMSPEPGKPATIRCFRVKRWAGGISGDHNARWRLGRGLNKGQRSMKLIVAKTGSRG